MAIARLAVPRRVWHDTSNFRGCTHKSRIIQEKPKFHPLRGGLSSIRAVFRQRFSQNSKNTIAQPLRKFRLISNVCLRLAKIFSPRFENILLDGWIELVLEVMGFVFQLSVRNYIVVRNSVHGVLLLFLIAAIANCVSASYAGGSGSGNFAPEISPSAASSALAVLAGCGLMLAERLRFVRK